MQRQKANPHMLPNGFYYQAKALSAPKSLDLFYYLRDSLTWQQPKTTVFGKTNPIPRMQCFIADAGVRYGYSGSTLNVEPWPDVLDAMRLRLNKQFDVGFNALLVNLYRDGNDCMGWHADDEAELGHEPIIVSISLGAERVFKIKHKVTKEVTSLTLHSGSCLVMNGLSQQQYLHGLPKQTRLAHPRINLTFRTIFQK